MHLQTVTFQRVFSVRRHMLKHGKMTEFGFVADGRTYYEARVYGWPAFEAGDKVTAALRVPDKWTSMLGWLNHANGEIAFPNYKSTWPAVFVASVFFVICSYLGVSSDSEHLGANRRILFLLVALFLLLFLLDWLHSTLQASKVRRALEALLAQEQDAVEILPTSAVHSKQYINGNLDGLWQEFLEDRGAYRPASWPFKAFMGVIVLLVLYVAVRHFTS